MSIMQFLEDIGNAINRMIQQVEEKIFDQEKTEYDDDYSGDVIKLNTLIRFTEILIDDTESMLQPNPALRLEGKLMEKVDKMSDRNTPFQNLATALENASRDVKLYNYELHKDFSSCSKYQTKLGIASKEFQKEATKLYVSKLKRMVNVDLRKYKDEEEILESLRLDFDSLRIRIENAITVSGKLSLEKEFVQVEKDFLTKLESNKSLFKGIDRFFEVHRELIKEFVDSQLKYYEDCYNDLQKIMSKMDSRCYSSLSKIDRSERDEMKSGYDTLTNTSKLNGTSNFESLPFIVEEDAKTFDENPELEVISKKNPLDRELPDIPIELSLVVDSNSDYKNHLEIDSKLTVNGVDHPDVPPAVAVTKEEESNQPILIKGQVNINVLTSDNTGNTVATSKDDINLESLPEIEAPQQDAHLNDHSQDNGKVDGDESLK